MIVKTGKAEVWQHAKEAGMSEKIALIAKYFDIKDVSIIYGGKLTYIEDRPRKLIRVPAHPSIEAYRAETKRLLAESKAKAGSKASRLKR